MKVAVCLFVYFCVRGLAQDASLTLASGSIVPGQAFSLPLSIANGSNTTASVQWMLSFSPSDFSSASVVSGTVADSASKELICNNFAPGVLTCLVSGLNASALQDGTLAVLNLTASGTISNGASVSLSSALGASPSGTAIPIVVSGATITVAPRISSVSCAPSPVTAPGSVSCTLTLDAPSPAAGVTVSLGYGTTATVSVAGPATVDIPQGATTGAFALQVTSASGHSTVQVAATLSGSSQTFTLQVLAVSVTLSPTSVTLSSRQQQQFTAAVTNTSNTAVTWTLNPNVGTISSSGRYRAPAVILSRQQVMVTAASAADPTKSATATITLTPPLGL